VSDKYVDFETRTSVHITLTRSTHAELRKLLFDHSLSMQKVFREFTRLLVEGDEQMISLLQRLEREKRDKITNKVGATDAESIFRAIERGNPLTES
jgi:hypothetical protein